MAQLILEGRTLKERETYAIGFDSGEFTIFERGMEVAILSKSQCETLMREVARHLAERPEEQRK